MDNLPSSYKKFCKDSCRYAYHNGRTVSSSTLWNIPTASVGLISELRTIADLTQNGYEVYRAVNGSARCDLVAVKDGKKILIEVSSGRIGPSGGFRFHRRKNKAGYCDIAAIVSPNGIKYEPRLSGS